MNTYYPRTQWLLMLMLMLKSMNQINRYRYSTKIVNEFVKIWKWRVVRWGPGGLKGSLVGRRLLRASCPNQSVGVCRPERFVSSRVRFTPLSSRQVLSRVLSPSRITLYSYQSLDTYYFWTLFPNYGNCFYYSQQSFHEYFSAQGMIQHKILRQERSNHFIMCSASIWCCIILSAT